MVNLRASIDLRFGATIPVSYTHLDVYKRQALPLCTAKNLHVSLSGRPEGTAGTIYYTLQLLNNGPECTVAPVVARGFNTTSSAYVCLLYTSRCV